MDGGFFCCPTAWEHLLPQGVVHLRNPWTVCRQRWRLLALSPGGCRMLAGFPAMAELLLLPGECAAGGFQAETVVTYGLSPRDTITLSSLTEPVLCVQREVPLARGGVLEPQEFPLPGLAEAADLLPVLGTRLLWTGSPYPP